MCAQFPDLAAVVADHPSHSLADDWAHDRQTAADRLEGPRMAPPRLVIDEHLEQLVKISDQLERIADTLDRVTTAVQFGWASFTTTRAYRLLNKK